MSSGWLRYCSSEACSIAISSGAPVERLRSSNIVRHSYIGKRKACLRPVSLAIAALPQPLYETADAVSAVKSTVSVVASTGILLTLATSALPLQQSQKRTEARQTSNEEEAEGVKWGLMSVVSCLPLFNWLAWVFAAFENEQRASFYYVLAALYATPQLSAGFQQDWLSLGTLILGVAHVQAERLLEERGIAQRIDLNLGTGEAPAQAAKLLKDTTRAFADALQNQDAQQSPSKAAETELQDDSTELKKWDELFNSKRAGDKRKVK